MAITVTHPFVSAIADGADATVVRPSNWNASHTLVGTVDVANGGTGSSTSAGAPFALKGANTDLTSVALNSGTVSAVPSAAFDLANKSYVDTLVAGLNFHASAQYATAAALAANTYNNGTAGVGATLTGNAVGALTVDSNVVVVAQRILVKNEVAGANNGVYVVTTVGNGSTVYVLTRATDFNTSGSGSNQVGPGDYVYITAGTANANTAWVQQTSAPITIGTTALVFTQFGVTGAGGTNTQVQFNASGVFAGSANLTFNGTTLAAAAITASTTLGVTGVSTLTGGAVIQGLIVGLGANAVATNTAVGVGALGNASGASTQNTAIGYGAMQQVVTGFNSTAVGHTALNALTSGSSNAAIGEGALAANSTGEDNTALGAYSLIANVTGSNNTAIGRSALVSNTGTNNLALGYLAGSSLTTGNNNTIIGSVAGTAGLSDTVIIAAGSVERMRIGSSGNVGIGGAPTTGVNLVAAKNITGSTTAGSIRGIGVILSDVTNYAVMVDSIPYTQAASFTLSGLLHFRAVQGTIGAGSAVTTQYGYYVDSSLTGATNNFGFYGNIASGTNRYNLYMAGTAANYLAGTLTAIGGISGGTF